MCLMAPFAVKERSNRSLYSPCGLSLCVSVILGAGNSFLLPGVWGMELVPQVAVETHKSETCFTTTASLRQQTLSPSTQNSPPRKFLHRRGADASSFFRSERKKQRKLNSPCGVEWDRTKRFGGRKCGKILGASLRFFTEWPHKAFATGSPTIGESRRHSILLIEDWRLVMACHLGKDTPIIIIARDEKYRINQILLMVSFHIYNWFYPHWVLQKMEKLKKNN